ncbi:hypothetical protein KEM55_001808, partial [Ascosphaera atra]
KRLEWLWSLVEFINSTKSKSRKPTGAATIDFLRRELRTGYSDIEEIVRDLLRVAENAWVRGLALWVLYGEVLDIREHSRDEQHEHDDEQFISAQMPDFVTPDTATSILFIGRALNQLKFQSRGLDTSLSPSPSLHSENLNYLTSLQSPISSTELSSAIANIRRSMSSSPKSPVCKLLPLHQTLDVLDLLHDFFLLGRGEFAVGLVTFAEEVDAMAKERQQRRLVRKRKFAQGNGSDEERAKEASVTRADIDMVLRKTWTEIDVLLLQRGDSGERDTHSVDQTLDLAREMIRLEYDSRGARKIQKQNHKQKHEHAIDAVPFNDTLFSSTPLTLTLHLPPHSALPLLFPPSALHTYSTINAYLLSLRRAQLRLSSLWKTTHLRRTFPAPAGSGYDCQVRRQRENQRLRRMRKIWVGVRRVADLIGCLGGYFGGEVVEGSGKAFRKWLVGVEDHEEKGGLGVSFSKTSTPWGSRPGSRPGTSAGTTGVAAPGSQTTAGTVASPHDPESIAQAHTFYLAHLVHSLFLSDFIFTTALRELLLAIDDLTALITRLGEIQYALDLEEDAGVVDFDVDDTYQWASGLAVEESNVHAQLRTACKTVGASVDKVVSRLREIDDERLGLGLGVGATGSGTSKSGKTEFVPYKPAGVETLLMKLDVGGMYGDGNGGRFEGGYEFGASLVD